MYTLIHTYCRINNIPIILHIHFFLKKRRKMDRKNKRVCVKISFKSKTMLTKGTRVIDRDKGTIVRGIRDSKGT